MINEKAKLNPKIFEGDIEKKPARDGYGEGLVVAGEQNENVVVLTADLAESTRAHWFAKKFPNRFFEVGVAEQNMAAMAAGLAVAGKIPFISSYAVFSPGRNYEQIRTTIAYNDANAKIAGAHAGISVGPDGATHQATEDMAIMRVMPNMKVFCPCDSIEAKKVTLSVAKIFGPAYLRFGREKMPVITTEATLFAAGEAQVFWEPAPKKKAEAAIIACGHLVYEALIAAKYLAEKEKIEVYVINSPSIKPLDEKLILEIVKKTGAVVTAEEHQVAGGLGGAVAELLARKMPTPIEFIGLQDTFGESGQPEELMKKYHLDSAAIIEAVEKVIKRK